MRGDEIVGRFERLDFPEFGIYDVVAKVDTGAYSGAMYATHIRVVEGSKPRLYFAPFNNPEREFSTTKFHKHWVRSSNGLAVDRYFIDTSVTLNGKIYPLSISLADRSSMRYPVLLGRKFLRRNGFIVDVSQDNR
jgi:hypothetical protein